MAGDNIDTPMDELSKNISSNTKVDYVYKRCYVDRQGNTIDPRTPWDELLKYYHSWKTLLVSDGEHLAASVPIQAEKMIKRERAQRARLAQIHALEAQYLETRARERKRAVRKRIHALEAQYLESIK